MNPTTPPDGLISKELSQAHRKHKGVLAGVITGLMVVLAVVAYMLYQNPIQAANNWQKASIELANGRAREFRDNGHDISLYLTKINQKAKDYERLITILSNAKQLIQDAKNEIKPVNGVEQFDITGAMKKANESRDRLIKSYDEFYAVVDSFQARANATHELLIVQEGLNETPDTLEEATAVLAGVRKMAQNYSEFAQSTYGNPLDREFATAAMTLADKVDALLKTKDVAAYDKAVDDYTKAYEAMESFDDRFENLNKDQKNEYDHALENLRTTIASIEDLDLN